MKIHFVVLTGTTENVLMRSKAMSFEEAEKLAKMWKNLYPKYTVTIE